MRTSRLRTSFAAGASVAIAAAGLAAFAPAAVAVSKDMNFDCTTPTGTSKFVTTADITNLPEKITVGTTTPELEYTATITVPAATADLARNLFGTEVGGTADVVGEVDGVEVKSSTEITRTDFSLKPPATSGPLTIIVKGKFPAYVAATEGKKVAKLKSYTATLLFWKNKTEQNGPVVIPCTAAANLDTTVDTFEVVPVGTPTTPDPKPEPESPEVQATKVKATKPAYKAKAKKVVTKVTVANADGTAATGDVTARLKKGKKNVGKAVTVSLNKKGVKKVVFKKTSLTKGKYKLVLKYKGNKDVSKKSNKKVTFKVK